MVSGNKGCIGRRRDWSIGPKVQDMFQPIPGIDHQLCWDARLGDGDCFTSHTKCSQVAWPYLYKALKSDRRELPLHAVVNVRCTARFVIHSSHNLMKTVSKNVNSID